MQVRATLDARSLAHALCEAENDGDWERWRSLVAEDLVVDVPEIGVIIGVEQNLAFVCRFQGALDDYRRRIFDVVCEADAGAYRFEVTGRRRKDGVAVEVTGAVFFGTRDGRIVRVVELLGRDGHDPMVATS